MGWVEIIPLSMGSTPHCQDRSIRRKWIKFITGYEIEVMRPVPQRSPLGIHPLGCTELHGKEWKILPFLELLESIESLNLNAGSNFREIRSATRCNGIQEVVGSIPISSTLQDKDLRQLDFSLSW